MSNCYICSKALNRASSSKEHILSNACGGRLISFRLLCRDCNQKMGADFDSELARQVRPLMRLLDIKRDRRPAPAGEKDRPETDFDRPPDGDALNKSIAKSAVGFFLIKKGDKKFIDHIIPFFLNKEKLDTVLRHVPDRSYYTHEPKEVSHILKLVGNPSEQILYCYIELFNTYRFIVRLNDHYDGPLMDKTYIYDLLQGKELKKQLFINYSRADFFSFFTNTHPDLTSQLPGHGLSSPLARFFKHIFRNGSLI